MGSKKMGVQNVFDSEGASSIKARICDLSEQGAKQALYGLVDIMRQRASVPIDFFRDCIDDAAKYTAVKRGS